MAGIEKGGKNPFDETAAHPPTLGAVGSSSRLDLIDDLDDPLTGSMGGSTIPNYNWNIFRYTADYVHLIGVGILIYTL